MCWSLKKENKGASLIAVIIALAFVLTIGGIVLNMTMTNIQMREAELSGKKNFYSAEEILDEIAVACNNAAASAMVKAYTDVLANYKNISTAADEENTAYDVFKKAYMKELEDIFLTNPKDKKETIIRTDEYDVGEVIYVWGYYNQNIILSLLAASRNVSLNELKNDKICTDYLRIWLDAEHVADASFTADYTDGLFTLQNIRVDFTDERGYETTIITDMILSTPDLNFDGTNKVMNYMKYALIADDCILVDVSNVTVNGSAYAGSGGIIFHESDNATFEGANIVTRGDIDIQPDSDNVTIGNGAGRIWAENIKTSNIPGEQFSDSSSVTINGNCYVADDLTLGGYQGKVKLLGSYYGYNFRENYTGMAVDNKAEFSSAIIINGQNSYLDLSGLDYLMIAGKTFISKGGNNDNSDIVFGESLSVRTNQLAYYVPARMLNLDNEANPTIADNDTFNDEYEHYSGVADVLGYLDTAKPVVAYQYRDNGLPAYRYYLNFKGDAEANEFFAKYWNENRAKLSSYADAYADAIILDDNTLLSLKGDLLYRNEGAAFQMKETKITPENWTVDGVYYTYADMLAINYRALQTWLEDSHVGINSDNVRFYNDSGTIDKSTESLFDNLVAKELFDFVDKNYKGYYSKEDDEDGDGIPNVVIVDNKNKVCKLNRKMSGVVIASGDVEVNYDFSGMILAKGKITFTSGRKVTSNELLVSKIFSEDIEKGENSIFAKYFYGYSNMGEEIIGNVQIDKYLSYGNWTRTVK